MSLARSTAAPRTAQLYNQSTVIIRRW